MRHWTQDAAYVAALVALATGLAGVTLGYGWPVVALCALSVAALVGLRSLEYRKGVQDGLDVRESVAALLKRMDAAEEQAKKTHEDAALGLKLAREGNAVRAPPRY